MEFANIAELRQNASQVFARLEESGEVVIVRNGRPIGILVAADSSSLDAVRVAVQRARSQLAVDRLREASAARGRDRVSVAAIDRLVQKTRRERARAGRR